MAATSWEMQAESLLLSLHPSEKGDPPREGMFPPPPFASGGLADQRTTSASSCGYLLQNS